MKLGKILGVFALSTVFTLPHAAQAATTSWDAELSANVGMVTEYSFRGIAQSDENFAVQGGFDIAHGSGLYAGVWGSNVDFNDGDQANIEIDLYGGYSGSFNNVNYDLGLIYYSYPGARDSLDYDFWEGSFALGYDFDAFVASASVNYSPEYFGDSGDAFYYSLGLDIPVTDSFGVSAHGGYQTIDDNVAFGIGDDSYLDWSLGLNYTYADFDFSLAYVDTNLDEPSECADGCDARVIFGISKSF